MKKLKTYGLGVEHTGGVGMPAIVEMEGGEFARLADMRNLIDAGAGLANAAYNLAQAEGDTLTAKDCRSLDAGRKDWDAATRLQAQQDADKVDAQPYVWKPGPDEFKDWCATWFGQDSDESYLAEAVFNLPPMAQKFNRSTAQPAPAIAGEELSDNEIKKLSYPFNKVEGHPSHFHAVFDCVGFARALLKRVQQYPAMAGDGISDEEIIALNAGEKYFSVSESKYGKEFNPHLQYHTGEPGLLEYSRALLKRVQPASGEDARKSFIKYVNRCYTGDPANHPEYNSYVAGFKAGEGLSND